MMTGKVKVYTAEGRSEIEARLASTRSRTASAASRAADIRVKQLVDTIENAIKLLERGRYISDRVEASEYLHLGLGDHLSRCSIKRGGKRCSCGWNALSKKGEKALP